MSTEGWLLLGLIVMVAWVGLSVVEALKLLRAEVGGIARQLDFEPPLGWTFASRFGSKLDAIAEVQETIARVMRNSGEQESVDLSQIQSALDSLVEKVGALRYHLAPTDEEEEARVQDEPFGHPKSP